MSLLTKFWIIFAFTIVSSVVVFAGGNKEISMTQRLGGFYTGGNGSDEVNGLAIDKDGNYYVLGTTNSTAVLVGKGGYQTTFGGGESDVFLIKYDNNGAMVWSTYFGGTGADKAFCLKLSKTNKLYICGSTNSPNAISTAGSMQAALAGETDGFIACFDTDGKLSWSTYFGGTSSDEARGVDVDEDGNIIIAGNTSSTGISSGTDYQKTLGGLSDGFILKLDATGNKVWSTYYGGTEIDSCKGVAIQNGYYIVVAGSTKSTKKISTTGAYQDTLGGLTDAYVASFLTNGDLLWGTYFGGKKDDWANDVICDSHGNVIVTGHTQSTNGIATDSAYQRFLSGLKFGGAFVAKFNSFGEIQYATYYGGSKDFDYGNALVCDNSDSYIMVGSTKNKSANSKIASQGAWQDTLRGEYDAFAVKFNENNERIWGTYYGGDSVDLATCAAVDSLNNVYFGGKTFSPGSISSTNTLNTAPDGFIGKLSGVGNVMFNILSNDTSVFPLKVTLRYKAPGSKTYEVKLTQTVADSLAFIIYDTPKEMGQYAIRVEQAYKMTYLPFDITIGDRYALMKLTWLRPSFTRNNFKMDSNSVSNVAFYTSNNGIYGLNIPLNRGGVFWPRGTKNQYIFGAGIWVGAMKNSPEDGQPRRYVIMSYNPNNGNSWVVPGRFEENKPYDYDMGLKYQAVKSPDYNKFSGELKSDPSQPKWPLWIDKSSYDASKFGSFIFDNSKRNTTNFAEGAKIFSDEDVYTTFVDNDLDFYDGGKAARKAVGYPLGLQFEQVTYTWGSGFLKDALIVSYKITNISKDTLNDCWAAPVIDYDISDYSVGTIGSSNDRGRYYLLEDSLQLGVGWSNGDKGETGKNFGYIGFSLLETPAVNLKGYLRKDKPFYRKKEQIGLQTYRNWTIADDKSTDDELYYFISNKTLDGDNGPGDKRALLGTGPFIMLPNDTIKIVLLINFAPPAVDPDPTGTDDDMANIVNSKKAIDKFWTRYVTDVEENEYGFKTVTMTEPYPNPVNRLVNLDFSLHEPGNVSIELYNILGEKIKILAENTFFDAGNNSIRADFTGLPDGQYTVSLRTARQVLTGKIIIMN